MKIRIRRKIMKRWLSIFQCKPEWFRLPPRHCKRRSQVLSNLLGQLDNQLEYHYGRYCK
jgi:hypothetical protein